MPNKRLHLLGWKGRGSPPSGELRRAGSQGLLDLSFVKIGFGIRHKPTGDRAHLPPVGTIKGKKGFSGQAFAETEEPGVFGQGATSRQDAEAKRVLEALVDFGWGDFRGGVGRPVEIHKFYEKSFLN
jgi:hypothetical protein